MQQLVPLGYGRFLNTANPISFEGSRMIGLSDSFVKNSRPNWRSDIKNGFDATNAYSCTRSTIEPSVGRVSLYNDNVARYSYDSIASNIPMPDNAWLFDSANNDRQNWLYKKFTQFTSPTQLGVAIYPREFMKSVESLRSPFHSLLGKTADYARKASAIRGKYGVPRVARRLHGVKIPKRSFRSLSRDINNAYLEYTYGIQPLIHDIHDAIDEITSHHQRHEKRISAFAGYDRWYDERSSLVNFFNADCDVVHEIRVRYADIYTTVTNATISLEIASTGRNYGIDLASFLPNAWEVIPYSFVLDYFSNIGDALNAISLPTPHCRYGYTNTKRRIVGTFVHTGIYSGSVPAGYSYFLPNSAFDLTVFTREPVNYDLPRLQLEMPNLKQTFNLLSLVVSKLL